MSKHTRNPIKYLEELYYNSDEELIEEFREVLIEDYGYVTINNLGTKVYTKTGIMPPIYEDDYGYLGVYVGTNKGKHHFLRLHRLVALAFLSNINNYKEVNHKYLNKKNNCITNLEWCTTLYNNHHAREHGRMRGLKGSENGRAKLSEDQVKEIKEKYTDVRGQIAALAREYDVSWSLIKFIVTNRNWTHC